MLSDLKLLYGLKSHWGIEMIAITINKVALWDIKAHCEIYNSDIKSNVWMKYDLKRKIYIQGEFIENCVDTSE